MLRSNYKLGFKGGIEMHVSLIIAGSIVALIAVALGIYTYLTAHKKGPILSNTYLLLSREERKNADKNAEYKLVTVVFGCLTAIFTLLALLIFTGWSFLYIPIGIVVVFVIVYAIVDAVKTEKQNR